MTNMVAGPAGPGGSHPWPSPENDALVDLFTSRAERAASIVHRCTGLQAVAELVATLAGGRAVSVSQTLVERYPELVSTLTAAGEVIHVRTAIDADAATVGVSVGEALVVETGSVLVAEHSLADRGVSMLAQVLVQVVHRGTLIASLDEVGVVLSQRAGGGTASYFALMTGPSRTADIERSLTIGVQGPAELHVAIVYPVVDSLSTTP
jgi:L-lactate dehydrogenase complex protein LldG